MIRITPDMAFIPIMSGTASFGFCTLAQLIGFIPSLTLWFDEWAKSPERAPSLTPPWARAIGLSQRMVEKFADLIFTSLVTSEKQMLRVADLYGHEATLVVPPRARLRKPPAANVTQKRHLLVKTIEEVRVAITPGGSKLAVKGKVSALVPGETLALETKRQHKTSVLVSKHIHPNKGPAK
jgi:hypothetical protein